MASNLSSPNCSLPLELRQILRDKIAAIAFEILEIAGAKIVDHGEPGVRTFLLQTREQDSEPMKPAPPVTSRLRWESVEDTSERCCALINKS